MLNAFIGGWCLACALWDVVDGHFYFAAAGAILGIINTALAITSRR